MGETFSSSHHRHEHVPQWAQDLGAKLDEVLATVQALQPTPAPEPDPGPSPTPDPGPSPEPGA